MVGFGWLLAWLAWATASTHEVDAAEMALRRGGADAVFRATFEDAEDVNYDRWPDFWKRRTGPGFPHYLKIEIADDPVESGRANHGLRVRLDGGGAELYSPRIPASPLFSYVLRGRVRTSGLKHDVASVSLWFQDAHGRTLERWESRLVRGTTPQWQLLQVGPVTPGNVQTRFAIVVLRLVPNDGIDLTGEAWFDDLWVGRLPRMSLEADSAGGIYTDGDSIEIRCTVSGSGEEFPDIRFILRDATGKVIDQERRALAGNMLKRDDGPSSDTADSRREFAGTTTWHPEVPGPGYYRIEAEMTGQSEHGLRRTISLAVLEDTPEAVQGEFGWSLPQGERPFSVKELVELLPRLQVRWVKFPAWYGPSTPEVGEKLAWFAERLTAKNIEMVGMLDQPPRDLLEHLPNGDRLSIAAIFLDSDLWQPSIDPVMVRLSLKVRWWQLGGDEDFSFIDFPHLAAKIREIKQRFDQFGQKTKIGMSWKWLVEGPGGDEIPWSFLSFSEDPPFTGEELGQYVEGEETPVQRWVMLRPLSKRFYSEADRMKDLVGRMVAAKVHGATAVIATNPFDRETGLFTPEGYPTELLVPWVTTARLLGKARFLGSLQLPNGSHNYVFERDGEAILVAWAERSTREVVYLGDDVVVHDLWGRSQSARTIRRNGFVKQDLEITPMPVFITGVHLPIAQWRLAFQIDRARLDSLFGRAQVASYHFKNTFPSGIGGKLQLVLPPQWETDYHGTRFKLLSGDTHSDSMRVTLGADATSGPQPVRIDFDVTAQRRYQFSVYRTIEVGLGDVTMEVVYRIDADGNLVVDQHLDNQSDQPISFNCLLLAPGRRRMRQSVFHLRQGRTTVTFVLPNGKELIGRHLRVRAEEIRGNRLLNQQILVKP